MTMHDWRQRYSGRVYPEPKGENRVKHLMLQHGETEDSMLASFQEFHPHAEDYEHMSNDELLQDPEFKRWTEGWHDGIYHHESIGIDHDHA